MTSPQHAFGDYQLEIYGAGLRGVLPGFPMAFAELEARAEQALPPSVLSYVAGGAGSEHTQRANVGAFLRWGLVPRMFVGAAQRMGPGSVARRALESPARGEYPELVAYPELRRRGCRDRSACGTWDDGDQSPA